MRWKASRRSELLYSEKPNGMIRQQLPARDTICVPTNYPKEWHGHQEQLKEMSNRRSMIMAGSKAAFAVPG